MGGVTCWHCCSGACCKHNKGYCQLVEGARSYPVKSTPPIILISRRTSPHPIPRARWCGADGGEPTAGPRPGARLPRALYDAGFKVCLRDRPPAPRAPYPGNLVTGARRPRPAPHRDDLGAFRRCGPRLRAAPDARHIRPRRHAGYGIVKLTLRPAQCRDEHSPAPLPSASLSARYHQPCRLALPQILHELPGC